MRRLAVVIGAVVLLLSVAQTATADPATVTTFNDCFPYFQYEFCYEARLVSQTVATPSGNFIIRTNGRNENTIVDPATGAVYQDYSGHSTFQWLFVHGDSSTQHFTLIEKWTIEDVDCSAALHFQLANGEIVRDTSTLDCSA